VGGGIRRPEDAVEALKAGADIIVTGTIAEESFEGCREIIRTVKSFKT
jgi:phosphoglycerol geranylgeranyltransferase